MARPILLRLATMAGVTIATIVFFIALLAWQLPWFPVFDDGPFAGRPVAIAPTGEPIQRFPVKDFVLEVHSPATSAEAPIVVLRNRNKKVIWAIHAEGMEKSKVTSVEFNDYRTIFDITVRGTVKWTYGHEGMTWIIGRDGTLKEYWYSW